MSIFSHCYLFISHLLLIRAVIVVYGCRLKVHKNYFSQSALKRRFIVIECFPASLAIRKTKKDNVSVNSKEKLSIIFVNFIKKHKLYKKNLSPAAT
jgi:hypothetical protein